MLCLFPTTAFPAVDGLAGFFTGAVFPAPTPPFVAATPFPPTTGTTSTSPPLGETLIGIPEDVRIVWPFDFSAFSMSSLGTLILRPFFRVSVLVGLAWWVSVDEGTLIVWPEARVISFIGPGVGLVVVVVALVGDGVGFFRGSPFARAWAAVPGFGAVDAVAIGAVARGKFTALFALRGGAVVGVARVLVGACGRAVLALLIPPGMTTPL